MHGKATGKGAGKGKAKGKGKGTTGPKAKGDKARGQSALKRRKIKEPPAIEAPAGVKLASMSAHHKQIIAAAEATSTLARASLEVRGSAEAWGVLNWRPSRPPPLPSVEARGDWGQVLEPHIDWQIELRSRNRSFHRPYLRELFARQLGVSIPRTVPWSISWDRLMRAQSRGKKSTERMDNSA